MRQLVWVVLGLLLFSCGSDGPCKGAYTGTYKDAAGNSLSADNSCNYAYTNSNPACASSGTYAAPLGTSGTAAVTIKTSSGAPCLAAGSYSCAYSIAANGLTLDCGAGSDTFVRQ